MNAELINGYVRPLVTVGVTGVFCWLALVGTVTPDVFVPTVTMILVYWFKSRDEQKTGEQIIEQIKEAKK